MPVILFSGSRKLNEAGVWNDIYGFSNFFRVDFHIDFQGASFVLPFYTKFTDAVVHAFSFNSYNSNDNKCRIVTGKFKFAGRYITEIGCVMSYNLEPFIQLDSGAIYVQQIIGYR